MKMQKLVVLWTSTSEDTFYNMVSPFALNSQEEEWFREVLVLLWGGSVQTVAKHPAIKSELGIMKEKGITVKCRQKCAEQYGIDADLEKLNIDLVPMSYVFKDYMQEGARIVSV